MILTVADVKARIQMWAIRNIPEERLTDFLDAELIDTINQVAREYNAAAAIHMERYRAETTAAETNYELQGVIAKVLWFYYEDAAWVDQHWTFVLDTIVLEDTPGVGVQMDIEYVRDIEEVTDDTDEIDLPEVHQGDFMDLLKMRLKVELADLEEVAYQAYLQTKIRLSPQKTHYRDTGGTWRHWFIPAKGDDQYDITENWVSQDSVTTDVDGNYYFIS